MGSSEPNLYELLLDLHLDRIGGADRAWIESELDRDASLRQQSDQLGRLLEPLDHWTVAPGPANLTEKVLLRVQRETRGASTQTPQVSSRGGRGIIPFPRMRELVAVAACLLLLVGVFVPSVSELRYRSRKAACASNLGAIFSGLSSYQETFAGVLPFAGGSDGASWLPGGEGGVNYASNSRHPYLLVKLNFGPETKHFVCPSANHAAVMDSVDLDRRSDFALAANMTYDSQNLSGRAPILRVAKTTAYLADRNPLFVNAHFNESVNANTANSPAHRRRGQTILTLDGSVKFLTSPVYGPNGDNPWILGNIRRYKGTETERSADDAFLVPGYPVSDPAVGRSISP